LTRIPVIVLEAYPTPPPLTRNLFSAPERLGDTFQTALARFEIVVQPDVRQSYS
jgi:hypothetical protein